MALAANQTSAKVRIYSLSITYSAKAEIVFDNVFIQGCSGISGVGSKVNLLYGFPSSPTISSDAYKSMLSSLLMAFSTGRTISVDYEVPAAGTTNQPCWVSRVNVYGY